MQNLIIYKEVAGLKEAHVIKDIIVVLHLLMQRRGEREKLKKDNRQQKPPY